MLVSDAFLTRQIRKLLASTRAITFGDNITETITDVKEWNDPELFASAKG